MEGEQLKVPKHCRQCVKQAAKCFLSNDYKVDKLYKICSHAVSKAHVGDKSALLSVIYITLLIIIVLMGSTQGSNKSVSFHLKTAIC